MRKDHVLVKYCSGLSELRDLLKGLNPDDIITITQEVGYTVVYKSNSPYDWNYKKH